MKRDKILVLNTETLQLEEREVEERIVSYETIRDGVDGLIERFCYNRLLNDFKIDCWCNEEGKLIELPISLVIAKEKDGDYEWIEAIAGNVVFTGRDCEGNSLPLTEQQIEVIKIVLREKAVIVRNREKIRTVRILKFC